MRYFCTSFFYNIVPNLISCYIYFIMNMKNFAVCFNPNVAHSVEVKDKLLKILTLKGICAEAIDIATNSLSLIETGNGFMTLATLEKMCRALNVEPYEIFKFHEDVNKQQMYEYLKHKLEFIKNDEIKLRSAYSFFQNLI